MNYAVRSFFLSSVLFSSYLPLSEASTGQNHKISNLTLAQTPEDLEAEELQAYAEEYAALADFEDLDALADEWLSYSDVEDEHHQENEKAKAPPMDDAMDMTM